ncbi:SIS domain-containing protein [Desulfovibrio sp. JC022]|uniref:SIS domain-containing protein n=1 Tax=Desulfovibrio sp. JC022 TaxID=2593642 RepID=UPI0034D69770
MQWSSTVSNLNNLLLNIETSGIVANDPDSAFARWVELGAEVQKNDSTIYLIGNGASASMASHFAADLSKNAMVRTRVFTDLSELTAIGNDISFDQIFAVPLQRYARPGDMLVAISSSGNSPNVIAAAKVARRSRVSLITLTGFKADNKLSGLGDINFYVPSNTYGETETCHAGILHHWMDKMENLNGR